MNKDSDNNCVLDSVDISNIEQAFEGCETRSPLRDREIIKNMFSVLLIKINKLNDRAKEQNNG